MQNRECKTWNAKPGMQNRECKTGNAKPGMRNLECKNLECKTGKTVPKTRGAIMKSKREIRGGYQWKS